MSKVVVWLKLNVGKTRATLWCEVSFPSVTDLSQHQHTCQIRRPEVGTQLSSMSPARQVWRSWVWSPYQKKGGELKHNLTACSTSKWTHILTKCAWKPGRGCLTKPAQKMGTAAKHQGQQEAGQALGTQGRWIGTLRTDRHWDVEKTQQVAQMDLLDL